MKTLGIFGSEEIRVYNKKDPKARGLWVDRETEFGNPYHIGEDGNRAEVIAKFERDLIGNPDMAKLLPKLRGKSLICHCKPKKCHGDVWFKYANGFWLMVTGGRDFRDKKYIFKVLDAVNEKHKVRLLIEGEAEGVDTLSKLWAISRKIPFAPCPADWSKGLHAGFARNTEMLKSYNPDLLMAFPGGKGTAHCVREGQKLGIEVSSSESWVGAKVKV